MLEITAVFDGTDKQLASNILGKVAFRIFDPSCDETWVKVIANIRRAQNGAVYIEKAFGVREANGKRYKDVEFTRVFESKVIPLAVNFIKEKGYNLKLLTHLESANTNSAGNTGPSTLTDANISTGTTLGDILGNDE